MPSILIHSFPPCLLHFSEEVGPSNRASDVPINIHVLVLLVRLLKYVEIEVIILYTLLALAWPFD